MSVAISWANKKQLAKCVYMVGFPIFSHIYNIDNIDGIDYIDSIDNTETPTNEVVVLQ